MPEIAEGVVVAGRFRLGGKIGQGGMGSVWRATQIGLDTPCAVKFLDGELGLQPEVLARFEREAKAAAVLRSPHVVAIIDHALWEGVPFIAMELLDGENLGDRIERVGRMSVADTLRVLGEVCRALTKAHQLGIVHRDLKPDNIFIVKDDDREITKVLDFGIAKTSNGLEGSKTRTGAMLGTPYYMSPEQAQGIRAVDFRADLWSMAVIAYQCLTGRLPFESEALGDLLMKLMVAPLPVPSEVAQVPPGFDAWWQKAASREPSNRFASAKEFIDTLTEALHGVTHGSTLADATAANLAPATPQGSPRVHAAPDFGKGTQLLGNTPPPDARSVQGTAQLQMSPVAAQAQSSSGQAELGITPSPVYQTFPEASASKKGAPMAAIGAIVGVLVVLAAGGLIVSRMLGGRGTATHDSMASSASAAQPSSSGVAGVPAIPPPTAVPAATTAAPLAAVASAPGAATTEGSATSVGRSSVPRGESPPAGGALRGGAATGKGAPPAAATPTAGRATPAASAGPRDFGF
jgi:serine/threonine-protein kinase